MTEPHPAATDPPPESRHGLRLVTEAPEPDMGQAATDLPGAAPDPQIPPADHNSQTGAVDIDRDVADEPEHVVPVKPLAPLDQRLIGHLTQVWQSAPRWSQRPPSLAEIWDYSTSGDWTAEDKSFKRTLHALVVVVTFAALYPLSWVIQVAMQKPIGFVITLAVLLVAGHIVF